MMKRLVAFVLVTVGWWGGSTIIALADRASSERFTFRTPRSLSCRIDQPAPARAATQNNPQWLKVWAEDGSTNFFELGSRVVVQLAVPGNLKELIAGHPMELSRTIGSNVFILQAADARTAAQEAHRLASLPGVLASYPVMRRQSDLNGPYAKQPTDYFFNIQNIQWPLEHRNTNGLSFGPDLNVRAAWPFTKGEGVTVAVADTGVELTHPELSLAAAGAPHHNFSDGSTNGTPLARSASAAHGTHVAGLAVAELNTHRMAGVAPSAKLASWVIIYPTHLADDEQLMDMYQFQSNTVSVQNHSWNIRGVGLNGYGLLEEVGISNAVNHGRSGRGVIMVRSAGNDRTQGANANDDASPSDPRVISVAAIRRDGRAASYSEPGSCLLVGGPSTETSDTVHLFTTDLLGTDGQNQINFPLPFQDMGNYIFDGLGFSGTSAAVPHITGVAALLLSANSNLTYRDVQQILILASRHFDFADPDLKANGSGFLVSHNVGFGLPDAGWAVQLARAWSNRPPLTQVTVTATNPQGIPDDGLRVVVSGNNIPTNLVSIRTLPSTGPHADVPTVAVPLVEVGLATNTITANLTNKGALIERGSNAFDAKINFAAQAGAAFAVVYNFATNTSGVEAPGGDQLIPMSGTDYVPIPAVFIGHTDGQALKALFQTNNSAVAQIKLNTTNYTFTVTNTLLCEHVGVRVMTDHSLRGDLRITLVSPSGKRSVLQRYNGDTSPGPVDWTYYSTQHFFESSAGAWTVYFSDEFMGDTGRVEQVSLTIYGTQIIDSDRDGLDDGWETAHFSNLNADPRDDPEKDGYSNMRELLMGTDPLTMDVPFNLDLSRWNQTRARLSWPGSSNFTYQVWAGTNVNGLSLITNLAGRFPEVEWFTPYNTPLHLFFRVQAVPVP